MTFEKSFAIPSFPGSSENLSPQTIVSDASDLSQLCRVIFRSFFRLPFIFLSPIFISCTIILLIVFSSSTILVPVLELKQSIEYDSSSLYVGNSSACEIRGKDKTFRSTTLIPV